MGSLRVELQGQEVIGQGHSVW